jgi:uncharacterized SAM-binding protein YcdF (DUF218 family)
MKRVLGRIWNPIRNLLAAFGLLVLLVSLSAGPISWWAGLLATPWHGPEGDVLVVLAGSHQGDVIGESSYLRALYAVRAYRLCPYRKIFLSGFEASGAMREFLVGQGVPGERIELENRSGSTRENVEYLAPLLRRELDAVSGTRLVLVTSDYHVYRSVALFRKAGFAFHAFPAPDVLKRASFGVRRWPAFLDLCQETVKIGYYRWRGWL